MAVAADTHKGEAAGIVAAPVHRILLVAPSPPPYGGMALQARQLEKRLKQDGNNVVFFPTNFALPGMLRPLDRIPGMRTLARALTIWILLWQRMKSTEVVHIMAASWLYFFVVVCPAVIVGRMRGKRVVLNYRGGELEAFLRLWGWLARPVFRGANVVTAPSEFLAGVIRRFFNVPVVIVPNILDTRIFQFRERTALKPRMLVTRHLEEIYDVESVLRAFRLVQEKHPGATLWIAGTGSQAERLHGLVTEWQLPDVRFLGHIPHEELPAIYDQCDIFLNASRVDNFPGALIEASAAGLVLVSTGAGGIPFIYQNEISALLVAPGDWKALAEGVERVLGDPAMAVALARRAAEMAQGCDWSEVRTALYKVYAPKRGSQCGVG
jgi:glycosyltransferase involved in cell wall biosynthesis